MDITLYTSKNLHNENKNNHVRIVKYLKYATMTFLSSYLLIKGMAYLRRRNPQIFLIKKHVGGTIGKYYRGGFEKKMTTREACLILSVTDHITKPELRAAHKKLMMLNHPDSGGSTFLASKINQAKELLMQKAKDVKH